MDGSLVECDITQVLVGQGTKCKDIRQLWMYRVWYLISSVTGVPSIDNCLVLGEHWESPKRLQRLFRSSATPSSPTSRDHSRQQWWPELAVYTCLALRVSMGAWVWQRLVYRHTHNGGHQGRQQGHSGCPGGWP